MEMYVNKRPYLFIFLSWSEKGCDVGEGSYAWMLWKGMDVFVKGWLYCSGNVYSKSDHLFICLTLSEKGCDVERGERCDCVEGNRCRCRFEGLLWCIL